MTVPLADVAPGVTRLHWLAVRHLASRLLSAAAAALCPCGGRHQ